jgi:CRP/FNR family transcriptional regulator, cyclic AMP receptor protein
MANPTTKAVLQQSYLCRGLPAAALERLAALALRRAYDKDAVIFNQGDQGDALYSVVAGRVRISASDSAGQEVFLNIMEPGDTFGEIAVMDGLPRTASATTLEPTTLVLIQRNDFLALLAREPQLALHLLKLLCERLRWTSELVEESAFLTGPARLAKRLLVLASLHGRPAGDQMELRISQAELANFLGISRQLVNQQLQEWRKHQWVELKRNRIIVRDALALRRIAG